MADEVTYDDLLALTKIKDDTTVEKFGGQINSHFYDGANILGTLSQKKLVQLPTGSIGQNPVILADLGTQTLNEAKTRSKEDLDNLDLTILIQIKNGKDKSGDVSRAINIRARDLAMHLYKLQEQNYITSEFKGGIVSLMLTEHGFSLATSGVLPVKPQPMAEAQMAGTQSQQTVPPSPSPQMQPPAPQMMQKPPMAPTPAPEPMPKAAGGGKMRIIALIVIILILIAVGYAYTAHYI